MAKFIGKTAAAPKNKELKIAEHDPGDLIIVYRKSAASIDPVRGWENQGFHDAKNRIYYHIAWTIDRVGNISDIENEDLSVAVVYRGATVGNISIDYGSPYDPGPVVTDGKNPIVMNDFELTESIPRYIALSQPDKFYSNSILEYTMVSNGYFSASPGGHIAAVLRCDTGILNTAVRGQGLVMGNVRSAADPMNIPDYAPNQLAPSTQLESWLNGLAEDRSHYLLNGDPNPPILRDLVQYRVRIQSYINYDRTNQTIRYTISDQNNLIYDSGTVVDPNRYFNPSRAGVAFGHVFSGSGSWSVKFSDLRLYNF